MFWAKVVERIEHTFYNNGFHFFLNRAVCEVMCENLVQTDRQATGDNIIWRMRCACWLHKATDTHTEYVTLIAFPRQRWLRERPSFSTLYVHCLSCCVWDNTR